MELWEAIRALLPGVDSTQYVGMQRSCVWCGERITFVDVWRHDDGSFYRQRCDECGWLGAEQVDRICPNQMCLADGLRDDHVAVPVLEADREAIREGMRAAQTTGGAGNGK